MALCPAPEAIVRLASGEAGDSDDSAWDAAMLYSNSQIVLALVAAGRLADELVLSVPTPIAH